MTMDRREFLAVSAAAAMAAPSVGARQAKGASPTMYGLIGKITAVAGQRDALAALLLESTGTMPGCFSYVVAADPADADALWVTEVWDSTASHKASLSLPAVQAVIPKARPLIAAFSNRVETVPIGGHGIPPRP